MIPYKLKLDFLDAIKIGNLEIVKFMLNKYSNLIGVRHDISRTTNDVKTYRTALHVAAAHGHDDIINFLLTLNIGIDEFDYEGNTALHLAIENRHTSTANLLINSCANINIENQDKKKPLMVALIYSQIDTANLLLRKGANIYELDSYGNSVLHILIKHNNYSIISTFPQEMLKDFTSLTNMSGDNLSHIAARHSKPETLEWLIKNNLFNYDGKNLRDEAPLEAACNEMNSENVDLIRNLHPDIYNGRNISITKLKEDEQNLEPTTTIIDKAIKKSSYLHTVTPETLTYQINKLELEIGKRSKTIIEFEENNRPLIPNNNIPQIVRDFFKILNLNNVELVEFLLNEYPNLINARDEFNNTALHIAAENNHAELVDFLCNTQIDVNAINNKGNNPLHIISSHNNTNSAHLLISRGANIHAKNFSGYKPIHIAILNCTINTIRLLSQKGTNLYEKDSDGNTLAHWAVINNAIRSVDCLTQEINVPINIKNNKGQTLLHMAAVYATNEGIYFLVKNRGMDLHEKDYDGQSPKDIAIYSGKYSNLLSLETLDNNLNNNIEAEQPFLKKLLIQIYELNNILHERDKEIEQLRFIENFNRQLKASQAMEVSNNVTTQSSKVLKSKEDSTNINANESKKLNKRTFLFNSYGELIDEERHCAAYSNEGGFFK